MLAAFVFVSVVPLVVVAGLSYWRSTQLVERFLAESVGKTASAYASDLDLFLERQRMRLRGVPALDSDVVSALEAAAGSDPSVEALVWVPSGGSAVATAGASDWARSACVELQTEPGRVMTHAGDGHAHEVVVAVSRRDGILCGQVSFTLHQDMLTERANSVMGGTAYIVNREGTVVCHAFEEHEPHVHRGDSLGGLAAEVAATGEVWAGMTETGDGPAFAAFAPATDLPWGVWVEVPKQVAAGPLWRGLTQTLGYAGLLALVAMGLALLFVRRLIGPVQDVAEAVRTVADGRYGEAIPVRGDDEVAQLAHEFNRMSSALQASYAELDERVATRTRELRSAREFSDLLLDTMQERILVIDGDLTIVRANDAALEAYGRDIVGCGCKEVHQRTGAGSACPARRVLESGQSESEERLFDHDGQTEILAVDTYPLPGGDAVVEISRDVTELKRIQAQLAHQEKMAALGTLAAGMAHEIGNPLASMSSELEMLERMWDPDEARESLPVLRDQVRRMSSLLRELVEFGRRPSEEAATILPTDVLEDVTRLLRHDPRSRGVEIAVHADPAIEMLCTGRDRLVQVLVNLGINALDAMDGDGRLEFRLGSEPTGGVRFEVADTGPGVPDDVAKEVFDPFFTTKPPGRGTGLGLFVSERIVQGLGGRMELHSSPTGAVFAVVLPDCACGDGEAEVE